MVPTIANYCIFENGKPNNLLWKLPDELESEILRLVETYEAVRALSHFDKNHCPIMEFVTSRRENYFLQYHKNRDFSPRKFKLERKSAKDEIALPFVRGATEPDGMVCKMTVYYGESGFSKMTPGLEDGSYDFHWGRVFSELQVRKRKLQLRNTFQRKGETIPNIQYELMKFVGYHETISKLFKPQVSSIHILSDIFTEDELEGSQSFSKRAIESRENQYIDLHVVSDGEKGFIRRED